MTSPATPGAGLSYRDLCAEPSNSEIRTMWRSLTDLAEALGIPTHPQTGFSPRTKTVDELLVDLDDVLPDGVAADAAARAALSLLTPLTEERVYEVRRLTEVGDHVEWVPFRTYPDKAQARMWRDELAETTGELHLIVEVTTTKRIQILT